LYKTAGNRSLKKNRLTKRPPQTVPPCGIIKRRLRRHLIFRRPFLHFLFALAFTESILPAAKPFRKFPAKAFPCSGFLSISRS